MQASASLVVTSTTEHLRPSLGCFMKCSEMSWVGLTSWLPNTLNPVRQTQSNIGKNIFYQQYQRIQIVPMLKFKEIRRSIINQKDKPDHSQAQLPTSFNHSPLMFRKKSYQHEVSPLRKDEKDEYKYETGKKPSLSPLNTAFCHSEFKENSSRNMAFTHTVTFGNLSQKKMEFNTHLKRKTNCQEQKPSIYTETSQYNTPTKSNLSFASLIHSKKQASNSKYLGSERKQDRESSISKLKDKLFAMKRVISDKEKEPIVPVTPKQSKQCQTNREMGFSPYQPSYNLQDVVKISLKGQSPESELDMSPWLS